VGLHDYIVKQEPCRAHLWSNFEPESLVTSRRALSHTNPTSEATSRAQDSDKTNALYMVATTVNYIFYVLCGRGRDSAVRIARDSLRAGRSGDRIRGCEIFCTHPDRP
jgi:hypothetical protein